MTIKKIEEMDYYELLNLERNASQEEIERAYLLGIAAYRPDSLASYGLVPGEDRGLILTKIEEAYQTLRYEDKRKEYNEVLSKEQPAYVPRARFRKSVQRLEIGCAHEKKGLWKRLKKVLFSQKLKEIEGRRKTARNLLTPISRPSTGENISRASGKTEDYPWRLWPKRQDSASPCSKPWKKKAMTLSPKGPMSSASSISMRERSV